MGGGKSKSETKTDTTTKVTTNTTTDIGDIGLTGDHAVEMAAILQAGATARNEQQIELAGKLFEGATKGFQKVGEATQSLAAAATPANKTPQQLLAANAPAIAAAGALAILLVRRMAK